MLVPESDTEKLTNLVVEEHGAKARSAVSRYVAMFRINGDWDNMVVWGAVLVHLANPDRALP